MVRSYVISVSLETGCYRHIQISASATLQKLHSAILSAFGFSDDHQHAFFMNNRLWDPYEAFFSMPLHAESVLTSSRTLKKLKLQKGDKFKYLFDFGDEWVFQCKVLRELDTATDIPGVIRSVGKAPEQYPEELDTESAFPSIFTHEKIAELFAALPISQEIITNVHRYFDAAARLYGIVPLYVVHKLYNDQNPPISEADFLSIAEIIRHEANLYCILGAEALYLDESIVEPMEREVISMIILHIGRTELYYALSDQQDGKAFLVLAREDFLQYADPTYLPDEPQIHAMRKFLKKHEKRLNVPVDEVLYVIYNAIWLDLPLQHTVDGLEEVGFHFKNQAEISAFVALYQELNNHTGKVANRGASPMELRELWEEKHKKAHDARNVLRNLNQISLFDD